MGRKNAKFQLTSDVKLIRSIYYYSRGLDAVPVFTRTLKVMLTDLSIVPLVIIAHILPTEPSLTVITLGSKATSTPVNMI